MFFFVFLSFLVGLLSGIISLYFFLLYIPLFLYLFFYRKERKALVFSLAALIISFVISYFYQKGSLSETEMTGVVVFRKENYCLFLSFKGKYLIYDKKNNFPLFSIWTLNGKANEITFSHFESGFDFKEYLKGQGVFYSFFPETKTEYFKPPDIGSVFETYPFVYLDKNSKLLSRSLLFGESLFSMNESYLFDELGLSSALSLSGFHLSFLIIFVGRITKKRLKKLYPYLGILISFPFLLFSGFSYSMRRVFIYQLLLLINRKSKTRTDSLELVSFLAVTMLFFEPYSLISPSFYYPFPFIIFLKLTSSREKRKKISFFLLLILFFLPMKLYSNHGISLLGPLIEILLIPYTHLLFILSILLFILPQTAYLINILVSFLLFLTKSVYDISPFLMTGEFSLFSFAVFYVLLLPASVFKVYYYRKEEKVLIALASISLLVNLIPDFRNHTEIVFIDVGQGDCTLIRHRQYNLLIDTGGKVSTDLAKECLIPYFRKRKIRKIDSVLITHRDYDHYGALNSLQSHFQVGRVYYGEDFLSSENNTLDINGISFKNLNDYDIGTGENDHSAVYQFSLGKKKILVMGDAPKEVEKNLFDDKADIDCDILHVGHHGSDTSSYKQFIKKASPEVGIISVGMNNSYGFPHIETLITLRELGIQVRRTDLEGTISYIM